MDSLTQKIIDVFDGVILEDEIEHYKVDGKDYDIQYNTQRREWELVTAPGVYGNEMVYSMANNDKFLFLGTIKGLYRINKKSGLVRDYQYAFIGQVNDIILEDNIIWLGTINGLLRFKWKRDL